jgi:hypothetical protein
MDLMAQRKMHQNALEHPKDLFEVETLLVGTERRHRRAS